MFSEVCPFCGKTYKRLKSHLPHCKAAASSDTHPISHEATRPPGWPPSGRLGQEEKPPRKQSEKGSKVSAGNSAPSQSPSSASLPSAKKKKQKLPEQTKAAAAPPSPTSQPPSLHPSTSQSKKTTDHPVIGAEGPRQIIQGAPTRTRENPPAAQRAAQTEMSREKGVCPPASRLNVSKKKETEAVSFSRSENANERTAGGGERSHDWGATGRKLAGLSVNADPGIGHRPRISLQDVKAALGRDSKTSRPIQSSAPSSSGVAPSAAFARAPLQEEQWLSPSSPSQSKPASPTPLPPLPSGGLSSQVRRAVTGLSTVSPPLAQFTSTKLVPASVETLGQDKPQDRRPNISESRTEG